MATGIEWCEETWNPVTGCSKVSEGCRGCYAERMARRLAGRYGYPREEPFAVTWHPDRLGDPARWKKPRMVFVCSMGDFHHKDVREEWQDAVLGVMADCPQHTFLVLTKRPENMLRYFGKWWPLPNVWLGVTAENQMRADERIPALLRIPAARHFVSCEPMLGPVNLRQLAPLTVAGVLWCQDGLVNQGSAALLDWVICGGESGPGARPMQAEWARGLRDQCVSAGVPFFFKQWGGVNKKAAGRELDGRTWDERPVG